METAPPAKVEAAVRGLCANAYLGDGSALCRVLGRYKMLVDTRDDDVSAHLLLDGFWELWVTRTLLGLIKPGMVCVDVGAHLGYFSLLMADLTGPGGQVHAFEPNAALRGRLARSAAINGFDAMTQVHPWPLSDRDGVAVRLVVPPGRPGGGHIQPAETSELRGGSGVLHTRRLDGFAEIPRVDVVKIDAEASEQAIWRGMKGLIDQGRPLCVLLEFAAARYPDSGAFLSELTQAGFSLELADPRRGLRPVSRAEVLAAPVASDQMLVLRR
ncbi:FkbM family methyltransferase [Caulobacter vibrioides]|nr:FkbM family methyltransferase [Caulobacter vibrioides]